MVLPHEPMSRITDIMTLLFFESNIYMKNLHGFFRRYGLQSDCQVSQNDVTRLESVHKLSVLRVRYHQGGLSRGPNNLGETAFVLNFFCDRLFNFK